ncbi:AzlC family ABC transporter permease [Limosilactobacillus sp.]|uniref:AzlC family ABC transporter permease n=1 Tax=Limosilactobacillus sp. TaxID=2773925 RepID=UPI0025C72FCC|nr:AzlC family ABC transporter permease [Limosilactobacillus sp.]MCH3921802.1 AzlC family ABC transporter permease [Limosilactobacillus sp.]MCH3928573.1 AzlC family ABC transporter permease [Limosilactobacillus sp.]
MAKAQINPEKARWLEVLGIAMPLCLSYIPIGLACGILLHAAGFNFIMTLVVSIVVFSGGAQFILASLLTIHAPLSSIFMTLFFLELRYALLGSSLSKYIKNESQHFIWLFAVSMNDENYAVNYLKFATDKKWSPQDGLLVEHYSLISWSVANMVGGLIGSAVSIDLEVVDFALTALFLYMIVMQVRSHLTLLICLLSAVLAVCFLVLTKNTLGIVIATLIASFVGFMIENAVRKHSKNPEENWFLTKVFRPIATRTTIEDQKEKKELKKAEEELVAEKSSNPPKRDN